jgi:hypothetical protein
MLTIASITKIACIGTGITHGATHKPGFHQHPHSLPNPTPIVDFIVKAESDL